MAIMWHYHMILPDMIQINYIRLSICASELILVYVCVFFSQEAAQ